VLYVIANKRITTTAAIESVSLSKEVDQANGFVLTAYFSSKPRKRATLWKR